MPESEIGIWQQPALPLSVMFCFCLLHCGFQGAVALFGTSSPAALATTVGVLTEVPVMLTLVKIANKLKEKFKYE